MKITSITPQKKRQGRSSVFIDGEFAFGLDNCDLDKLAIFEGMEITQEKIDNILNEKVFFDAREAALRYLSYKPRTMRELETKLAQIGYQGAVIAKVINLMVKYGYIDDKQYTNDYINSRIRMGNYGLYRIKNELRKKGVDIEIIENGINSLENGYDEVLAIMGVLKQKKFDAKNIDGRELKRYTDMLARRGFSYASIRKGVNGFLEGICDE